MLQSLYVKNYALIEELQVDFSNGFTAITGETGAGKTILLGALSLVLGKRADLSVLRNSSLKCIIEAGFDISKLQLQEFFTHNDLDYDSHSFLRREMLPSGKSRAFINDTPVSQSVLKEIGEQLVDIHSQHQTLLLAKPEFQLLLFDSYINRSNLIEQYRQVFKIYRSRKQQLKQLKLEKQKVTSEEDYLRFQLNEIKAADTAIAEFEQLKNEEQLLSHAEEIGNTLSIAVNLLSENELSVLEHIKQLEAAFAKVAGYHSGIAQLSQRLDSVFIELKDIVGESEKFASEVAYDPVKAEKINEQLNTIYHLLQKHNLTNTADLLRLREKFSGRLNNIENVDAEIEELEKQFYKQEMDARKKAEDLSLLRKQRLTAFEKQARNLLALLGMPDAVLKVVVEESTHLDENGINKVYFLFSANKGSQPEEISKTASGGELSRLMLALKAMVQQNKLLPTIIFDEIDAGVSGEIAGKIGAILQEMGKRLQVIAITHLPQIAARAQLQLKVFKENKGAKTTSRIALLTEQERIIELASLISDEKITAAALQTAKDLLKNKKKIFNYI